MNSNIICEGNIFLTIEDLNGQKEYRSFKNNVLTSGKTALIKCLANEINNPFDFYISQMIFGTNGVNNSNTPKFVSQDRSGLFGATAVTKNVISSIDPNIPTTINLTSVLTTYDAVGQQLSEMALVLGSGDLYSMATFPMISKTSSVQLTFTWAISML